MFLTSDSLFLLQERKLLAAAQQTFQDSKTKIEQIRMEMLKLSQATGAPGNSPQPDRWACKQQVPLGYPNNPLTPSHTQIDTVFPNGNQATADGKPCEGKPSPWL